MLTKEERAAMRELATMKPGAWKSYAEVRNALPKLLDALDEMEAERDGFLKLSEALEKDIMGLKDIVGSLRKECKEWKARAGAAEEEPSKLESEE